MLNLVKLTTIFCFCKIGFSQEIERYKADNLKKIDSTILLYKNVQKKAILSLLPNLNYDISNNSFNVGISLSNISNFFQTKNRNNIELSRLENSLINDLEGKTERLEIEVLSYREECEIIIKEMEIFFYENQLFLIEKGKKEAGEITTEVFLTKIIAFKKKYLYYLNRLNALKIKAQKISKKINQEIDISMIEEAIKNHTQNEKNFGF